MPTNEDQPKLLAKLRGLSDRILDYRRRFSLPKGDKDRLSTHGAALGLQSLLRDRKEAQGKLDPIRLIATGISCRDCRYFRDRECYRQFIVYGDVVRPTHDARLEGPCGPDARFFEPVAAHA